MAEKADPWSVASLMKMSLYAAVNFAVFKAVGRIGPGFVIVLLAILNLLFFGFSRWNRGRADRKFWDWFELTGWAMIGLTVTFADQLSLFIIAPLNWLVEQDWIRRDGMMAFFVTLLGAILVYGLFPLGVATFAGRISSRADRRTSEPEDDRPPASASPGGPFSTSSFVEEAPSIGPS